MDSSNLSKFIRENRLIKYRQNDETKFKSYLEAIITVVVSIFFIVFLIRPSIIVAIELQKKIGEYKIIDEKLQQNVNAVNQIRSLYEKEKSNFYQLDRALPSGPDEGSLLTSLNYAGTKNGVLLSNISFGIAEGSPANILSVSMETYGKYENQKSFLKDANNLLRIFKIETINMTPESSGTNSIALQVTAKAFYQAN